ncbi:MAG: ABC transporter permease [Planctomycetota bacterium]
MKLDARHFRAAALAGLPLAVLGALLEATGYSSIAAARALLEGAFGSPYAFEGTLLRTVPLLFCGMAVALCFRAGLWNIGAEGQLLAGALAATAAGTRLPDMPLWILLPLCLAAGALAGGLVGGLAGGLRAWRGVPEVVSTLMLNFVLLQTVSWAVHGPLKETSGAYPQSDVLDVLLPRIGDGRVHLGLAIALIVTVLLEVVLFSSTLGFRLRMFGLSPDAAITAGQRAKPLVIGLMFAAGACAGLGGSIEVLGVTGRLFEGFSPGYGYSAIAVALLGRLRPSAILAAAFLFGALESGAGRMQRSAGVPASLTYLAEGLILITVLWMRADRSKEVRA